MSKASLNVTIDFIWTKERLFYNVICRSGGTVLGIRSLGSNQGNVSVLAVNMGRRGRMRSRRRWRGRRGWRGG